MRLLRIQEVISVTGISRMTIYRLEKEGAFPSRRRLGKNSVAWLDDDILDWVTGRPSVVPKTHSTHRDEYQTTVAHRKISDPTPSRHRR